MRCLGCVGQAGRGDNFGMEVVSGTRARCTVCGTVNPWVMDELLGGVTLAGSVSGFVAAPSRSAVA